MSLGDGELNEARRQEWLRKLCGVLKEQRLYDGFSTVKELSLLNGNLDLVIKNNLPGVYSRTQDELRLWLNHQLPSIAPVIGANGETSANRSVQARKFRMPGYPLILVSTDVFQEGEDLHTFCDSVIHYGLSSSPVSIEQKIGRVDRVGASAHRRLLGLHEGRVVSDDDFIQVRFPFVKQSIEAVQLRALCTNLNLFLASLHEVGVEGKSMDEFVDASIELSRRDEIPEQLMDLLVSPYDTHVSRQSDPQLEGRISNETKELADAVRHVETMLKSVGVKEKPDKRFQVNLPGLQHCQFNVCLDSARSCGEILLRVTAVDAITLVTPEELTKAWILEEQARLYSETFYRTYAIRVQDGYELRRDAEMLVGGAGITHEADIVGLFKRFSELTDCTGEQVAVETIIPAFSENQVNDYLKTIFHWKGTFSVKKRVKGLELVFKFNEDKNRRHRIKIGYRDGCCYFEARVADAERVKRFSRGKLLKCTWLRNRNVDLVGFLVRPDGYLVARAFHPASSINFEEFIFTAYVLAVEADRMEYLINESDEY